MGFMHVMNQMSEDGFAFEHDLLVQVGDMVDGYPNSSLCATWLKLMQEMHGDHMIVLKGNHEELMIHGPNYPHTDAQFQIWWQQGGQKTWESYWGGDPVFIGGYAPINEEMEEHIAWFRELPTMFETEDYIFVHAGVDPEQDDPRDTSTYARMWIRGPFLRSERKWDKMIVHGHSPVKEPELLPNRINVNTRPRNKGYVTGAKLSNDGDPRVLKLYKPPQHIIDMVNDSI